MNAKVVVSLPALDNEFQLMQQADARAAAGRLGIDVELTQADNNAIRQIQQLYKFIHAEERPKAIVVEPVAIEGMERVAQKAATAGIGWAILNCTVPYLDDLRRQVPSLPIFALGSDQVEIGRLQGRQMRILLPSGGTVLYIQGPLSATAARERLKGMQEGIAGSAIHTIIIDSQWTEDSADQAVRSWLRLKSSETTKIDLVAGQDDSIARGARRATEAMPDTATRWVHVPFLGIDGVPEVGQKLVSSGHLTATVVMPSNTGPALEALGRWLQAAELPASSLRVPIASFPDEAELRRRATARPPSS
jgi:ABC-type sugar transport system substrate-binding protein